MFCLVSFQFVNPEQSGYVGFANLPNQVHRKSVKRGFEFTLMVVGKCQIVSFVTVKMVPDWVISSPGPKVLIKSSEFAKSVDP